MTWNLRIARRAAKQLDKIPAKDQARITAAFQEMRTNPFGGDIVKLKNEPSAWRRRVGNYRIFFDVHPDEGLIDVVDIMRRTTTTY